MTPKLVVSCFQLPKMYFASHVNEEKILQILTANCMHSGPLLENSAIYTDKCLLYNFLLEKNHSSPLIKKIISNGVKVKQRF